MSFNNQVVYITGGSTGIGLALAEQLAQQGAKLALFARNESKLNAAKATIKGSNVFVAAADAQNHDDLERAFNQAVSAIGTPDMVINCVGRAYPNHFENITTAQMEDTMKANFTTIWNASSLAVKLMKDKGGKLVNTSSIGGFVGVFGFTDYSASKFAIIGFSEALKQEVGKYNIKVQVLCPPDTDTPGFETENKTKPEETKRISGTAKLMTPHAVAKATIKALKGNDFIIVPNFDGKLTYFMKRHFPFIVNAIMDSSIKAVQKGK